MRQAKTDETARMCRMIYIVAGNYPKVLFLTRLSSFSFFFFFFFFFFSNSLLSRKGLSANSSFHWLPSTWTSNERRKWKYTGSSTTMKHTQQAHSINMTSYQRRCDLITSHRRWYDVILTLCAHLDRLFVATKGEIRNKQWQDKRPSYETTGAQIRTLTENTPRNGR